MNPLRVCAIVPTYDNPRTIRRVVEEIRAHVEDVIVVDDGSGEAGREAVGALAREGLATAVRREANGGKGAAVRDGLRHAAARGYTHALQIDGDLQHDTGDIPTLLARAEANPEALVLASPRFDASAPKARRWGRMITVFWIHVETFGRVIDDAMCGFRVYPIGAALAANARGDRMDFDPEIAVRMVWNGVPVINVPTSVRYVPREDGGVSHFRMVRDNVVISWMHTRLVCAAFWHGLRRLFGPRALGGRS